MTSSTSYARFFRIACAVLQVLFAAGITLFIILAAVHFGSGNKGVPLYLPKIDLALKPITGAGDSPEQLGVKFAAAQAVVSITNLPKNSGLIGFVFFLPLALLGAGFLIVNLGHRLFLRIEKREPFAQENPQLVRRMAFVYLAFGVLHSILNIWYASRVGPVLDAILIETAAVQARHGSYFSHIAWGDAVSGLLLLLLAGVYQEAVMLKEESQLTI